MFRRSLWSKLENQLEALGGQEKAWDGVQGRKRTLETKDGGDSWVPFLSYKAVPGVRGRFPGPRLLGREARSVDTSC